MCAYPTTLFFINLALALTMPPWRLQKLFSSQFNKLNKYKKDYYMYKYLELSRIISEYIPV